MFLIAFDMHLKYVRSGMPLVWAYRLVTMSSIFCFANNKYGKMNGMGEFGHILFQIDTSNRKQVNNNLFNNDTTTTI